MVDLSGPNTGQLQYVWQLKHWFNCSGLAGGSPRPRRFYISSPSPRPPLTSLSPSHFSSTLSWFTLSVTVPDFSYSLVVHTHTCTRDLKSAPFNKNYFWDLESSQPFPTLYLVSPPSIFLEGFFPLLTSTSMPSWNSVTFAIIWGRYPGSV